MLVLARRPEEKILFPTLGVSVEILRVTGQVVRVGVEAPKHIPVVRGELKLPDHLAQATPRPQKRSGSMDHYIRGRLNTAVMAMYLAQKQLQSGLNQDADSTLQQALHELDNLEKELAALKAEPAQRKNTDPIKALLVEDNVNESALLRSFLQLSGVQVARANDGCDALDYLEKNTLPDAVLLDMRMPRCDGPATLSAIRQNPAYAGLKIFGVSGSAPTEYNIAPGRDGVDGWFTKPLNPEQIVETLTKTFKVA